MTLKPMHGFRTRVSPDGSLQQVENKGAAACTLYMLLDDRRIRAGYQGVMRVRSAQWMDVWQFEDQGVVSGVVVVD